MEITNKSILKVSGKIVKSLAIKFFYEDSSTANITVSENDLVKVRYIDNLDMIEVVGKIITINYINNYNERIGHTNSYNIKIDCSSEYSSDVRTIALHDIRDLEIVKVEEIDPDFNVEHTVE